MLKLISYSFLTGFSLILGVILASVFKFKQKTVAAIMAYGTGTLICALTFGLMEESFKHGGFDAIVIGFLLGGSAFILGDFIIHFYGGRNHKKRQHFLSRRKATGQAITLGAVLDGIPESVALGIALLNPQGIGFLLMSAIFLSNLPESIASANDLAKEGYARKKIFIIWFSVAIASILITILSYLFLKELSFNTLGILESFAAGAILAMLVDSMMPEAFEYGGPSIGILTVIGFLTTFILSKL